MIQHLVDQIHLTSWQRHYRKKPVDNLVQGWAARLGQYAWGGANPDLANHLVWLQNITTAAAQYPENTQLGEDTARDVLTWGGVTRGNVLRVPLILIPVVKSARTGVVQANAPMNAGWTKIAAVFSYLNNDAPPQVIWDSRVSLSVCTRLGIAALAHGAAQGWQATFPNLGWSGGRGGNRPALQQQAQDFFPDRYRSWSAHFAGGLIAQNISDILNGNPSKYGTPCDELSSTDLQILESESIDKPTEWTPWLVACVLFMDGY